MILHGNCFSLRCILIFKSRCLKISWSNNQTFSSMFRHCLSYFNVFKIRRTKQNLNSFELNYRRWNMFLVCNFFTASQQSCGKVMFSIVSVILFGGFPCNHYPWWIGPHHTPAPAPAPDTHPPPWPSPRHVQTCTLWNMYGWQAGVPHPTGMLSCSLLYLAVKSIS